MLKALLHRMIHHSVERPFGYDASYMHDLADASPASALKFSVLTGIVDRKAAPGEALAAVGITGTLAEDCGPCTQISVDMALKGGVSPAVIRAILAGDLAAMGENAALGYRFARGVLAKDLEEADACRDEIVRRWGAKGLAAMSLSLTAARMYPTLKYALGHGRVCSKLMVAGQGATFVRPELTPA